MERWQRYTLSNQTSTQAFRRKIFTTYIKNAKGEYWRDFFNYPLTYVEWDGRFGVITPTFSKQFFFESGRFQGKEKGTKWFISAKLRNKFLKRIKKEHGIITF